MEAKKGEKAESKGENRQPICRKIKVVKKGAGKLKWRENTERERAIDTQAVR